MVIKQQIPFREGICCALKRYNSAKSYSLRSWKFKSKGRITKNNSLCYKKKGGAIHIEPPFEKNTI